MKNILLIRHGQSEWNKLNLFTGFKNIELSSQGVEEANKAGQNFIFKRFSLKHLLYKRNHLQWQTTTANFFLKNMLIR